MTRSQHIENILAQFEGEWGKDEYLDELEASMGYLTLAELEAVQAVFDEWGIEYIGSIGHDIHGIAALHYGPKYHRDSFVPRMVKLPKKVKGEVAK